MSIRSHIRNMLCATAVLSLVGPAFAADPIKVGFITELSGPWAFAGSSCNAGLKLAQDEITAKGGVLGRPLEFVVVDSQTNPTQALAAARRLDTQDKVVAISGPTSSDVALALYGYAEQNKLPFIAPVAAFPQLTKPGTEWTFRMEPSAIGWGYALSKFVNKMKPGAKVALMYSDFALMRAIMAGVKYQAKQDGLTIVADIAFPAGSQDAAVQAAQVLASGADFVIPFGAGGFDNTINNQLLDLGFRSNQIVHPIGFAKSIVGWGARGAGSYYGTFFEASLDNLTADGKKFVADFTAKAGHPPSYTENFCYQTAFAIRQGIENAGTADRMKLRDAMRKLKIKETTTGLPIEFDANGARKEYIYFMQIKSIDEKKISYESTKAFYAEWNADVIPVYELMK